MRSAGRRVACQLRSLRNSSTRRTRRSADHQFNRHDDLPRLAVFKHHLGSKATLPDDVMCDSGEWGRGACRLRGAIFDPAWKTVVWEASKIADAVVWSGSPVPDSFWVYGTPVPQPVEGTTVAAVA